jgi:hypothetical protein
MSRACGVAVLRRVLVRHVAILGTNGIIAVRSSARLDYALDQCLDLVV